MDSTYVLACPASRPYEQLATPRSPGTEAVESEESLVGKIFVYQIGRVAFRRSLTPRASRWPRRIRLLRQNRFLLAKSCKDLKRCCRNGIRSASRTRSPTCTKNWRPSREHARNRFSNRSTTRNRNAR